MIKVLIDRYRELSQVVIDKAIADLKSNDFKNSAKAFFDSGYYEMYADMINTNYECILKEYKGVVNEL